MVRIFATGGGSLSSSDITAITDPLYLHLDQTTPQTLSGGAFAGSGLLKITSGLLGVDTNAYVTGTPWTGMGYLTDAPSDGKTYGRNNGVWVEAGIPKFTSDPSSTDGDFWYRTDLYELRGNINGATMKVTMSPV